jgi:hypothetical protein
MGFNLQGGMGAGAGADMLQQILKQKALEFAQAEQIRMAEARTREDARQADQSTGTARRGQDLSAEAEAGRLGLGRDTLGQRKTEFDAEAPQREASVALSGAQTGEILRKPTAEQESRDFTTGRDKTLHGYDMQSLGAQQSGQMRLANARVAGASAPTPQTPDQQNEVQDSLALVEQIRKDPALASSTGPVEGRGGGWLTAGPEGFTRVKALHDNLVNKMQLAQAGKLKGQGQISNMEREMLKNAATALTMKLGDADYLNELAKVEAQFQRMLTGGGAGQAPAISNGATVNLIWDGAKFVKPGGK